jgi:hypothetical protein
MAGVAKSKFYPSSIPARVIPRLFRQVISKKVEKKVVIIKTKYAKSVEERVTTAETAIKRITESINKYFQVDTNEVAQKKLTKRATAIRNICYVKTLLRLLSAEFFFSYPQKGGYFNP